MAADPMRFRQTYAVSDNIGFSLKLEQFVANGSWQYGLDGYFTEHNAEITNPNAAAFYIDNSMVLLAMYWVYSPSAAYR